MKKIFLSQLVLLFLTSACEKTSLTTATDSVSRPVVEAYLAPGQVPSVKITHQLAFGASDTIVQPVKNLDVTIESEGLAHPLVYSSADSAYVADGSWEVEADKNYRLAFVHNGALVTAESQVPAKPVHFLASATSIAIPHFSGNPGSGGSFPTFPDPIDLTWENNDGAYYLVVVENLETDPVAIYDDNGGDRPPRPVFRSEPEQTNTYQIGFQSFKYYGTHRVVLYKLNSEYASLYDDNGNSSQNLTAPYSNVVGGLGIFTGLNADTLLVEVTK